QHLSAKVRGKPRDLEVVGLAKNTNAINLRRSFYPAVYVSYAQLMGDYPATLEIRASGSLAHVASAVRNLLQSRLQGAPHQVRTLSAQVEATIVQERMIA